MITVNCIGLGQWGPNLVRLFATHPETRVGAVCDLRQDRIDAVMRNVPGISRSTTDALAAATDPAADAIVIATHVKLHHPLAKAALEAGKHVLVEKPIATSSEEAEELVRLATVGGRLLAVGHVFLFNAGVREMARLVKEGHLGKVHYVHCTRTNLGPIRTDVNALWDLASHDLSIVNYWLDAEPATVTARGHSYLNPSVEDVVLATFTYPGDVLVAMHASWLNPKKVREITVIGESTMAVWNDMEISEPVRVYHKSVAPDRRPSYSDTFGSFRMLVRNGDVVIPYVAGSEPLAGEVAHFVDCVQGRSTPVNGPQGGLAVLRALEAADRSMREGSALVPVATPVPGTV